MPPGSCPSTGRTVGAWQLLPVFHVPSLHGFLTPFHSCFLHSEGLLEVQSAEKPGVGAGRGLAPRFDYLKLCLQSRANASGTQSPSSVHVRVTGCARASRGGGGGGPSPRASHGVRSPLCAPAPCSLRARTWRGDAVTSSWSSIQRHL